MLSKIFNRFKRLIVDNFLNVWSKCIALLRFEKLKNKSLESLFRKNITQQQSRRWGGIGLHFSNPSLRSSLPGEAKRKILIGWFEVWKVTAFDPTSDQDNMKRSSVCFWSMMVAKMKRTVHQWSAFRKLNNQCLWCSYLKPQQLHVLLIHWCLSLDRKETLRLWSSSQQQANKSPNSCRSASVLFFMLLSINQQTA